MVPWMPSADVVKIFRPHGAVRVPSTTAAASRSSRQGGLPSSGTTARRSCSTASTAGSRRWPRGSRWGQGAQRPAAPHRRWTGDWRGHRRRDRGPAGGGDLLDHRLGVVDADVGDGDLSGVAVVWSSRRSVDPLPSGALIGPEDKCGRRVPEARRRSSQVMVSRSLPVRSTNSIQSGLPRNGETRLGRSLHMGDVLQSRKQEALASGDPARRPGHHGCHRQVTTAWAETDRSVDAADLAT